MTFDWKGQTHGFAPTCGVSLAHNDCIILLKEECYA